MTLVWIFFPYFKLMQSRCKSVFPSALVFPSCIVSSSVAKGTIYIGTEVYGLNLTLQLLTDVKTPNQMRSVRKI